MPDPAQLATALNDGFDQPQEVTDLDMAFPADLARRALIPTMDTIPEEFQNMNGRTEWNKFVQHWFFHGDPFKKWNLYVRPDVDAQAAFRHMSVLMKSWEPKHEHKEAAVAWLASRWFAGIEAKES